MAPIAVGDVTPGGSLSYLDDHDDVQEVSVVSLAAGRTIILFSIPTATPRLKHVADFIEKAEELISKGGVREIFCICVIDPNMLKLCAEAYPDNKHVVFLADESATYTQSLGLGQDLSDEGPGIQPRSFALLVQNMEVKVAKLEFGGEFSLCVEDFVGSETNAQSRPAHKSARRGTGLKRKFKRYYPCGGPITWASPQMRFDYETGRDGNSKFLLSDGSRVKAKDFKAVADYKWAADELEALYDPINSKYCQILDAKNAFYNRVNARLARLWFFRASTKIRLRIALKIKHRKSKCELWRKLGDEQYHHFMIESEKFLSGFNAFMRNFHVFVHSYAAADILLYAMGVWEYQHMMVEIDPNACFEQAEGIFRRFREAGIQIYQFSWAERNQRFLT